MSFLSRVSEEWPDQAEKIMQIVWGELDPCTVPETAAWVDSCYHLPPVREQKMHAIDVLIHGFGVESVFGDDFRQPDMTYSNCGDSYGTTIVLDYTENRWMVTTVGDWIEHAEAQGRVYP